MEQKEANRYAHAKVYKIWNDVDSEVYVGSTCKRYLSQRFSKHRTALTKFRRDNEYHGMKLYPHMSKIGFEHFKIELLENVRCECINELRKREGFWIRELKANLNLKIPGQTGKEYRETHKDKIKEYRETHKDQIKDQRKEYRETHKDQANKYRKTHYEQHKYQINKKIACDCGVSSTHNNYARHTKSKVHQLYLMFGGLNAINV
jgi:hypothetical protein